MVKRLLVHGSKIRLCQLGGEKEDDQGYLKVRPGMLLDLLDSKVSGLLYQVEELQAEVPAEQSWFGSTMRQEHDHHSPKFQTRR